MNFLFRYILLLTPFFAIGLVYFVYNLIEENRRPLPVYTPPVVNDSWSAEEYIRHLKLKPFNNREVHRLFLKRTRQKQGVYLESMPPLMDTIGLEIVNSYHVVVGDGYTPVVTSGNDFEGHLKTSKHYMNAAFDFRIKDLPFEQRKKVVDLVEQRIGHRCKVIWERGEAEHLHVELLDSELQLLDK